jgi:hypothetical protein
MGSSDQELESIDQPNDVYAHNANFGSSRSFKMQLRSKAYFRNFDPKIDSCQWDSDSELGKLLTALGFHPIFWTYHPDFRCISYPHEERTDSAGLAEKQHYVGR